MAINKVIYQGNILVDLTKDTVTPETLMEGTTAHAKNGELIVGTATGGEGGGATVSAPGGVPVVGTWDGMSEPTLDQFVNGIYFNMALSAEEVVDILAKLNYPNDNGSMRSINVMEAFLLAADADTIENVIGQIYLSFDTWEGDNGEECYDIYLVLQGNGFYNEMPLFYKGPLNDYVTFTGWNPEFSGSITEYKILLEMPGARDGYIDNQQEQYSTLVSLAPNFEPKSIKLEGEYDGAGISVNENGKVDIESLLNEQKLPLSIGVNVSTHINYTIVDGATEIAPCAYTGMTELEQVVIPDGVETIGASAFAGCSSLKTIEIPNSVTSIGDWAFADCYKLIYNVYNENRYLGNSDNPYLVLVVSSGGSLDDPILLDQVHPDTKLIYGGMYCKDSQGVIYNLSSDGTGKVVSCDATATSVTIGMENYKITEVSTIAFQNCTSLTSVEFLDSVTTIKGHAFRGCTGLTHLVIGSGITSIGEYAFCDCSKLTNVEIGDSVTSIGDCAFMGCSSLTSIEIPNNVTSIGDRAFGGCSALQSIILPFIGGNRDAQTSDKTTLFGYIFDHYSSENTTKALQWMSVGLNQCQGVSYYIPTNLTSVVVTGSNNLPFGAFSGCTMLTDIVLPNGMTSIPDYAFEQCSALVNITIPETVTSFRGSSFEGCSSLVSLYLPDSVRNGSLRSFDTCSSLSHLTVALDAVGTWRIEPRTLQTLVLTSGTEIVEDLLLLCKDLTSITLPASIKSIAGQAFANCTSLKSVYYNGSIEDWYNIDFGGDYSNPASVGANVYINNQLITELIIPNTVTEIKPYAFQGFNSLSHVTIPNSVTSIGDYAFDGCQLQYVEKDGLKYLGNTSNPYLYLADAAEDIVTAVIDSNCTMLASECFAGCKNLTSVTIPNTISYIPCCAFKDCEALTSVRIPKLVTHIGNEAFMNCVSLTSINIPSSVTSIGDSAFKSCSNLTSAVIPASVTNIELRAFDLCSQATLYCEAPRQLSGWKTSYNSSWNPSNCPVVWDYEGAE